MFSSYFDTDHFLQPVHTKTETSAEHGYKRKNKPHQEINS